MRLRSRQRLRRQADFAAVRAEGRRQFGPAFVLAVRLRKPDGGVDLPRFAVVASRRVGGAVVRNRLRRQLRELFRENQQLFPAEVDVVVTLKPAAAGTAFADLRRYFLAAARRAGFGAPSPGASGAPAPAPRGGAAPEGDG